MNENADIRSTFFTMFTQFCKKTWQFPYLTNKLYTDEIKNKNKNKKQNKTKNKKQTTKKKTLLQELKGFKFITF